MSRPNAHHQSMSISARSGLRREPPGSPSANAFLRDGLEGRGPRRGLRADCQRPKFAYLSVKQQQPHAAAPRQRRTAAKHPRARTHTPEHMQLAESRAVVVHHPGKSAMSPLVQRTIFLQGVNETRRAGPDGHVREKHVNAPGHGPRT